MIYIDTSVVLAHLLAEDRKAPPDVWLERLVSSRLLEYEVWVRLNARGLGPTHGEAAREILGRVAFVELHPEVLARALEPFPHPVGTLDALHLASLEYVRARGVSIRLATFDRRMVEVARALRVALVD